MSKDYYFDDMVKHSRCYVVSFTSPSGRKTHQLFNSYSDYSAAVKKQVPGSYIVCTTVIDGKPAFTSDQAVMKYADGHKGFSNSDDYIRKCMVNCYPQKRSYKKGGSK